jgi:hypothetical protein
MPIESGLVKIELVTDPEEVQQLITRFSAHAAQS